MNQLVLGQFPWPSIPIVGLFIFLIFFIGILIQISLKSQRKVYSDAEMLPLQDGVKYE